VIYLTGFMGSGKTSVGRVLASRLGVPFVDLDERRAGAARAAVPEIFRLAGEEAFRALERKALFELATEGAPCVVATGGGLPVDPRNRRVMKASGVVVHLGASFETIRGRIPGGDGRPLWAGDVRSLHRSRARAYGDADLELDTDHLTVEEVARGIEASLPRFSPRVGVILEDRPYPVYIGKGVFTDVLSLVRRFSEPEGVFALVDANVLRLHGEAVKQALGNAPHALMAVPPGEGSKSLPFLEQVLSEMFAHRVNRQWVCLAIGGGVTGDLAGFAASVFMRGIPVVQVATTLLAQVDSAIGGKTAVNTAFGKNLVGTFHQPLFVLSDGAFINTLEPAQVRSAMAEVVKYGIVMDEPLFSIVENGPPFDREKIVEMCARDKARVVALDEREGGLRRILNFGHTLGHAVELAGGFEPSHGAAVCAGMYFAVWLSRELGVIEDRAMTRISRLLRKWAYPLEELDFPHPDRIDGALASDKKFEGEGIHFVLTPGVGDVTVKKITSSQILGAYGRFVRESAEGLR